MLRAMHTAASGMIAQQQNIDTISNNLANINTVGYKKSTTHFQDLFYQRLPSSGADAASSAHVQIGHGTRLVSTKKIHTQGNTQQTGNPLDVIIEGSGFFPVTMPDGTRTYTRDGSFSLNGEGMIVTANGFPLEPEIVIPEDATDLAISSDGLVTVRVAGETDILELGSINLVRFVNDSGLEALGGNLYRATPSAGEPIESAPGDLGLGLLEQGHIEMSNVEVVEEMVNMIVAQRAFEVSSKAIQTTDDMMRIANEVR